MTSFVLLYITTRDVAEAERIANTMIEEGLAACANILPGMRSLYRWEGKLERADEAVLILKTTVAISAKAEARVKTLHSYDCPCILHLSVSGGSAEYLAWLRDSLS